MKSKCQEIKWSVRELFTNFPFSSLIAPKLQPLSSNSYMDSSLTANRFLPLWNRDSVPSFLEIREFLSLPEQCLFLASVFTDELFHVDEAVVQIDQRINSVNSFFLTYKYYIWTCRLQGSIPKRSTTNKLDYFKHNNYCQIKCPNNCKKVGLLSYLLCESHTRNSLSVSLYKPENLVQFLIHLPLKASFLFVIFVFWFQL